VPERADGLLIKSACMHSCLPAYLPTYLPTSTYIPSVRARRWKGTGHRQKLWRFCDGGPAAVVLTKAERSGPGRRRNCASVCVAWHRKPFSTSLSYCLKLLYISHWHTFGSKFLYLVDTLYGNCTEVNY
jgi:hypothetical protein